MRGLGVSCYSEHYQITIDLGHTNSQHKLLLSLGTFEKPLINLYHKNAYGVHGTITLLDKQRLSLFYHIRTVHLDIIKVLFIHQLMH
jgi:hypothetical protein